MGEDHRPSVAFNVICLVKRVFLPLCFAGGVETRDETPVG